MPRSYTVPLAEARSAFLAELGSFLATVSALDDHSLLGASRAYGWSRVDCVVHVRMGLQELLAGMPSRTEQTPDVDAASYWTCWHDEADPDPVPGILLTRRTAAAYTRPGHAMEHLRQVASGLREFAATMADSAVRFQGHVISAGDLLATWAVELAVHHHDLAAPDSATGPTPEAVRIGRLTAEAIRDDLPATDDDLTLMLAGFGRA